MYVCIYILVFQSCIDTLSIRNHFISHYRALGKLNKHHSGNSFSYICTSKNSVS